MQRKVPATRPHDAEDVSWEGVDCPYQRQADRRRTTPDRQHEQAIVLGRARQEAVEYRLPSIIVRPRREVREIVEGLRVDVAELPEVCCHVDCVCHAAAESYDVAASLEDG